MKSKVELSRFSSILTLLITGALIAGCVATYGRTGAFITLLAILCIILAISAFYAPVSISADADYLTVATLFRKIRLPMAHITGAELFNPTMGAIRIVGSGGFMGYWGIFREHDIGRYAAFYGKASECFLVRLDNGDKYVLGCLNPAEMVACINSHLHQPA